jgi:UDP-glucuronate 4-epimerase
MTVLVTGAAGFIGYHVADRLLARGQAVVGLDNLNDYYDPRLKKARLALLQHKPDFRFLQIDLADRAAIQSLFAAGGIEAVVHLAAQAGVRYSITHPHAYVDSNLTGFLNLLEGARACGEQGRPVRHMVYASSSSVYGGNRTLPFSEGDRVDRPVSLYAATKRANELMAHVYALQFAVPLTGLRFFTVYGPWGRPDMATYKFTRAILAGEPIEVYNHGDMQRDFTYIDDIVSGVLAVLDKLPPRDEDGVQHRVYNIGNHRPEPLLRFIEVLGKALGRTPVQKLLPMQQGDVRATYADISALQRDYGWEPTTAIDEGLPAFVGWYRDYVAEAARDSTS